MYVCMVCVRMFPCISMYVVTGCFCCIFGFVFGQIGRKATMYASMKGHEGCLRLLIAAGVHVSESDLVCE